MKSERFTSTPLSWWGRRRHKVARRLPIRRCMMCNRVFFFPGFRWLDSLRGRLADYCFCGSCDQLNRLIRGGPDR